MDTVLNDYAYQAAQIARDAGEILRDRFGQPHDVRFKGTIDLVTEADRAAEDLIADRLRDLCPEHVLLCEEGSVGAMSRSAYRWVVDPLDGTTNYAHGYPCFCVSIALARQDELLIGVIYDPTRDELFAAERGAGATLNERRIRVSEIDDLNRAMLCTGFPYDVRERGDFARHFARFIMSAQAVRRDGSAALDLAYVACGRFDGFWEEGLQPWDVAAGVLLVEEAGGRVSRYDGTRFDIFTPPIIASNGLIHEAMMSVLQQ